MSKIKLILTVFIFSINMLFSQENCEYKRNSIYLNLNDKAIESYEIDRDTMNARFSIYLKKYESKKKRDKATKIYNDRVKNRRTSRENPSDVRVPTFSIAFLAFNNKPEKLKSIKDLRFITVKQFRDNNYATSNPTYIIHQLKDGTYMRWLAITIDEI